MPTAFSRTFGGMTNPVHIKPAKEAEAIARLNYDFDALITAFNALTSTNTYATAVLNLTADITLTSATKSPRLNGLDVTLQVAAAAANPTNTVLVGVTLVDNDVTITVTPNDGTNNGATPVGLTTAQLVLVINGNVTGTYDSIAVTVTDASSVLPLFTATGGGATALADSGEGDGVACSFWGGA